MFAKPIMSGDPEHRRMIRTGAQSFLDNRRPLTTVRAARDEGRVDRAAYGELAEMGWLGMIFESESELDLSDLVALHRELGRKVLPEPVVASGVIAAATLWWADNPGFADRLAALRSGETIATLAWQSGAGGLSSADCGVTARAEGTGWALSGTCRFVPWASDADALLVAARTAAGVLIGWVSPSAPGLTLRPGQGIDRGPFPDLHLDNVALAADDVVADPATGATLLDRVLDLGRLVISAELVGASEAVFGLTLDYIKERKQFGKPIGANQALQFEATNLFVQIELMNSVIANAARRFDAPAAERARLVAGCKARCSDAAFLTVRRCIQMHGAIGYTDACDISLYVKRIMQWTAWLGNGAAQRRRLQAHLLETRKTPEEA